MKQLKSDEQLGSVYLTEVTKKDILGGLDKLAAMKKIMVYVLVDDSYYGQQVIAGPLDEIFDDINNMLTDENNGDDISHLQNKFIDDIMSRGDWSWAGIVNHYYVEVTASVNKRILVERVKQKINDLNATINELNAL